nr:MAG TPA: hypothetical protein [Caudoviricetes sp.]
MLHYPLLRNLLVPSNRIIFEIIPTLYSFVRFNE